MFTIHTDKGVFTTKANSALEACLRVGDVVYQVYHKEIWLDGKQLGEDSRELLQQPAEAFAGHTLYVRPLSNYCRGCRYIEPYNGKKKCSFLGGITQLIPGTEDEFWEAVSEGWQYKGGDV